MAKDILIIGIAGGTGSGKTTITDRLVDRFGKDVSVIKHDNYDKAHHEMDYSERSKLNYDHPNSLDTDLMIEHIKALKKERVLNARYTISQFMTEAMIPLPSIPQRF